MKTQAKSSVRYAHPSQAALDSIIVLRLYSAGRADANIALQALDQLEDIYGWPLRSAVALFRRGLCTQDRRARHVVLYEALNHIIDAVFRDRIRASLWQNGRTLCRLAAGKVASLAPSFDTSKDFAERNYTGFMPG